MKIHILDDWHDTLRRLPSFAQLAGHEVTVWTDHQPDPALLAERLQDADALVLFRERTAVTEDLLSRLPGLKLIAMRGVHPHVDVEACTRHGVMFCSNKAGGTSVAAAELTFALILACARDLLNQNASLKAGHWQGAPGQTLAGRTLGLWGYGKIGKLVARYAEAFGMRVVWWGSDAGRVRAEAEGATVAPSREAFFKDSDFVSVHVRMAPETKGMITAGDLLAMRPSASFINTSRAGLVVKGALEAALQAGRPGRLGLDVFDVEPITEANDPLVSHSSVIATPHIGFVTEDELDGQFSDIYALIEAYAAGNPLHIINPEVRDA
ncbi:D-2-hydroxyacid dehydrogenase family protein [Pararhodobacter sp. CCB-MM2]|uniref:D-2-hydroxyacid dehydrogenase family protein n=1 Tax=Pararhodobacter sp. CCB-MM2 TaxID=1786003 RepID=UPI000835D5F6|nr:D-2-hydroxyacid dehydrogenase family protein [Pararhodobacter sp. CCB-MM2]